MVLCSVHPPILSVIRRSARKQPVPKWRIGNGQFTDEQVIERCPFSRLARRTKHAKMQHRNVDRIVKLQIQGGPRTGLRRHSPVWDKPTPNWDNLG